MKTVKTVRCVDVETKSGTVYRLDLESGWWMRSERQSFSLDVEATRNPIYTFREDEHQKVFTRFERPHEEHFLREVEVPVVGERFIIDNHNVWYISSEVVSVKDSKWDDDFR